jgi:hypothetical protein
MNTVTRDWDRVLTYFLFVAYGLYSIFFPIVSVERVTDHWLEIVLGADFIFAGASMLYGLYSNRYEIWRMGMSVACIGLTTITMLVAAVGGPRVYAYAFLFGAFACQSLYGIRRERRRRIEAEIRRQLEDIVASVRSGGSS